MFREIFLFEIGYRLRRPATYIYLGLYLLVGFLWGMLISGAAGPEAAGSFSGGGKGVYNSAYTIHFSLLALGQYAIFAVAAFMGVAVNRDFEYQAHELFFTRPVTKAGYLGGRYLGSLIFALAVMVVIAVGLQLAYMSPWATAEKLGPFNLSFYLVPLLLHLVPFTVITGTVFFATVSLTRNNLFIYLNAILLLVLFTTASGLSSQLDNKTLASLLDPTGGTAFQTLTENWTSAERNTQTLPLTAMTVGNQLIWLGVALLVALFTYLRFQMNYATESRPLLSRTAQTIKLIGDTVTLQRVSLPSVSQQFGLREHFRLLGLLTGRALREILRSPIFWVITGIGVLFMIMIYFVSGLVYETPTRPVTYQILGLLSSNFTLFILAIMVFYTGEQIWKERTHDVSQLYDTLPMPVWITLTARFVAMIGVLCVLMTILMVTGMIIQVGNGFFQLDPGQYITELFGLRMLGFIETLGLFFFIQILSNNKYLGFFLSVLVYLAFWTLLPAVGIEDRLWRLGSAPQTLYSDMNGFGHFIGPYLTYRAYWGALTVALLILAGGLWVRGTEDDLRSRWARLRVYIRGSRAVQAGLGVSLAIFLGMGGYIFYNTHVLNPFYTSRDYQRMQAEFEKTYKRYEHTPQPRITSVRLRVDLRPEVRAFSASGTYVLRNKHPFAVDTVIINYNSDLTLHQLQFSRPADRVLADTVNGLLIYRLAQPLAAGDSLEMQFEESLTYQGFSNSGGGSSLVYNGTFLNYTYFPTLGYNSDAELLDPDLRKKYNLPAKPRMSLIDDTLAVKSNLLGAAADWIRFEAAVGTAPDQIAVAPGYLTREWTDGGRRWFHYQMDVPMIHFYSIVSARYAVKQDTWQAPDGRTINLEIYHHPSHTWNLDRMMDGMKQSLAYYTEAFGPYQHRQVRILEFPRYAGFAQSFANTIPYSESVGFIANVGKNDVDYPFYITCHEVAHQWWAHQVVGGKVQGFQFLSETMSQYAALMVMEKNFGKENMDKFLELEMQNYLQGRTGERIAETPVLLSENQPYIHYNKGSVVMYALQDYLGEDTLNAALKRYVSKVKFQEPPYTTTREWMQYVSAVTPDSLRGVLTDLLETITLYENTADSATYVEQDGRYKVSFTVKSRKLRMIHDDESEVPINDYIDIGVFGQEKQDGKWVDKVLYLQKHKITTPEQRIEVWVDAKPEKAGIDPWHKLVDRKPADNTAITRPAKIP